MKKISTPILFFGLALLTSSCEKSEGLLISPNDISAESFFKETLDTKSNMSHQNLGIPEVEYEDGESGEQMINAKLTEKYIIHTKRYMEGYKPEHPISMDSESSETISSKNKVE